MISPARIGRSALQGARDIIDPDAAKQRKKDEEDRKAYDAQRRMDLRWLMADPRGRRIMSDLLARGFLLAPTFNQDQRLTDRAEGKRDLVLGVFFELLGACPAETLALFKEHPAIQRAIETAKASQ